MRWLLLFMILVSGFQYVYAEDSDIAIGFETRNTYTRWYEYPSLYWEEDFTFYGVRSEYRRNLLLTGHAEFSYGAVLSLFTGTYKNSPGETISANAIRPGGFIEGRYSLGGSLHTVMQLELAYLMVLGKSDHGSHADDFNVYLTSIDLGLGIEFALHMAEIKTVRLLYGFSLFDLGLETDTYVKNDVSSVDWNNSAIYLIAYF